MTALDDLIRGIGWRLGGGASALQGMAWHGMAGQAVQWSGTCPRRAVAFNSEWLSPGHSDSDSGRAVTAAGCCSALLCSALCCAVLSGMHVQRQQATAHWYVLHTLPDARVHTSDRSVRVAAH